jgi:hypothetical protein
MRDREGFRTGHTGRAGRSGSRSLARLASCSVLGRARTPISASLGRQAGYQRQFGIEAGNQHVDVFGIMDSDSLAKTRVSSRCPDGKAGGRCRSIPGDAAGIKGVIAETDDPDALAVGFTQAARHGQARARVVRHRVHAGNGDGELVIPLHLKALRSRLLRDPCCCSRRNIVGPSRSGEAVPRHRIENETAVAQQSRVKTSALGGWETSGHATGAGANVSQQ